MHVRNIRKNIACSKGISDGEKSSAGKRGLNLNMVVREGFMEKVTLAPKLKEARE